MTPKNSNKNFYLIFGVTLYIIGGIAICHAVNYMAVNPEISFILALQQGMNSLVSVSPFTIFPLTTQMLDVLGKYTIIYLAITFWLIIENEKNARSIPGKENGSSKWNDDIKGYNKKHTEPFNSKRNDGYYNMILSKDIFLSLNTIETRKNNNVLIVGGSGAGKSRYFVKPNILQANASFVVTDPSGELLEATGTFLREQGYVLKVFNLCDMAHSNCYNPFDYIRDDLGVLQLVNCLIQNTNPPNQGKGDPFWEKSETELFKALIFYLIKYRPPEERNFTSVMRLLRAAEVDENNPNAKSALDRIFDAIPESSMAKKSYRTFKMGAGKTLKSILISCAVRLGIFDLAPVANLTRTDMINPHNNLELEKAGDRKTAIFVVIPSADSSYNCLASMMYSQFFETLYYHAEHECPHQYKLVEGYDSLLVANSKSELIQKIEELKKGKIYKNENNEFTITSNTGIELQTFYTKELAEEFLKKIRLFGVKEEKKIPEFIKKKLVYLQEATKRKKLNEFIEKILYKEGPIRIKRGAKRLPVHIRFILDEFANIGQIPDFDKKLATMRKYEISCCIILQNLAQLQEMYEKKWSGIVGNCSSFLFLGSPEYDTDEYVSKVLGDATIVVRNNSRSMGKSGSSSLSYNRNARKLMLPDELLRKADEKCIVIIQGLFPFFTDKYDYPKHPNYKYTGDSSSSRNYYCKDYLNNRLKDENELVSKVEEKIAKEIAAVIGTDKEDKFITDPKSVENPEMLEVLNAKKPADLDSGKLILKKNGDPEEWQFDTFS